MNSREKIENKVKKRKRKLIVKLKDCGK